MSFSIPQVFISSTSEFAEERRQLQQALSSIPDFDFKPFIYEEESARSESPEKHCRAMLDASEIVVLIVGSKYGSSFPGRTSSIVEWEYECAKELNKELKGYVRDPPAAPPDPRQADFVTRVRGLPRRELVPRLHVAAAARLHRRAGREAVAARLVAALHRRGAGAKAVEGSRGAHELRRRRGGDDRRSGGRRSVRRDRRKARTHSVVGCADDRRARLDSEIGRVLTGGDHDRLDR